RLRRSRVRHARDPAAGGQADAARERGREVVGVALELDAGSEQVVGGAPVPGDGGGGNEPERDDRGARAEPALARDVVAEREVPAVGRGAGREGAHTEVVGVVRRAGSELELVPEVERRRGAVEAGTEVRGRRGRAEDHRAASAIESASGSTGITGGR